MTRGSRLVSFIAIAVGFAVLVPLQQWIDSSSAAAQVEEEELYLSNGDQVKRLAFGYDALLADIYWMRAIQHFGEKAISNRSRSESERTPPRLLYPLLDVTTTLDPHYVEPYRFGGFFLADFVDVQLADKLIEKGIRANPHELNLRLDLGFLLWRSGDCEAASTVYAEAGELPTAPPWIGQMSAIVLAECGKREFAVRMLRSLYESTEDPWMRGELEYKIRGYQALDEIDLLKQGLVAYSARYGSLPQSLALLVRTVRISDPSAGVRVRINASGQPVDPNGVPYVYDPANGEITTDPESIVLPRVIMRRYEKQSSSK